MIPEVHYSLKRSIKDHLEEGKKLTVLTCQRIFGTNELRHFVSELKKEGVAIKSEWEYSDRKKWKVYYL